LSERGLETAESHTNFVYFHLGDTTDEIIERMTTTGVLIRPMSEGWVRATIGDDDENRRFLESLDSALSGR
jgi:histidinol-phosphate/aromatic aminotransferase/cobyric acid decarboxylase-like protein